MADSTTAFTQEFEQRAPSGVAWFDALRQDAFGHYSEAGLPTLRSEAWKYTNLRRLERIGFDLAQDSGIVDLPAGAVPLTDCYRVVIVNGRFDAAHSALEGLPKGVEAGGLAEALARDPAALEPLLGRIANGAQHPLTALNTAYMQDGLYLRLADGAVLDKPLHLISVASAELRPLRFHPRHLIVMGDNSIATLVESHIGTGQSFGNTVTEISIGKSAVLQHYKLQNEAPEAFHIALSEVQLADRSSYDGFVLQIGALLARNEVRTHLGSGVESRLNGAYLGRGAQHIDNTTFIDHAEPNSTSHEVYKGVLDERARGVFQGKILVRKDAQKTDGHQLNKTLLLSAGTEMDTKPELEIYADDVKCSHGATTGEIEEEALFYLRSRGIDAAQARAMLVAAFVGGAIDEMQSEPVRAAFQAVVDGWLETMEASE